MAFPLSTFMTLGMLLYLSKTETIYTSSGWDKDQVSMSIKVKTDIGT